MEYDKRKIEHIELSLREDMVYEENCIELYDDITLVHQAIPGLKFTEVDTHTVFLGRELSAPILIEPITGGHIYVKNINENLAKLAEEFKVAIAVGSQRPLLKNKSRPEIVETYRVVREKAPSIPVIGNIGITQLREITIDDLKSIIDVIKADALAVHLNPAQEIIQPEGDSDFGLELVDKISDLVKEIDIPIIVKEIGNGLSMETISLLRKIGIRFYDIAGSCGTNWVKIEAYRNPEGSLLREVGLSLSRYKWGIPTPLSLIETKHTAPDSTIIASGGVWDGVNAVKLLTLGADIVGFARPVLKTLVENGYRGAERYISKYILELKTTMFLTGTRGISELHSKPIILGPRISSYMSSRGIDIREYINVTRRSGVR